MAAYEKIWKWHNEVATIPYWPLAMVGYDERPWKKEKGVVLTGRTPEAFRHACKRAKEYVPENGAAMIYCWNEWGEGGTLEPSVQDEFTYLEVVKEVFAGGVKKVL